MSSALGSGIFPDIVNVDMFINSSKLLLVLVKYKYAMLYPIAVFEGPILTIAAGVLSSLGIMHFWIAYPIIVSGDLTGDILYYLIGRLGREKFIYKYGKYIGLRPDRLGRIEKMIQDNLLKVFVFGKFAHGTGSVLWVGTGLAKVNFRKFVIANFITTAVKTLILMLIGYFFGQAYQILDTYFRYIALFFAIFLMTLYFLLIRTKFFVKMIDQ